MREMESAPPASITSASPDWISSAAAAIASAPEEHAVAKARLGPSKPNSSAIKSTEETHS